MQKHNKKIIFFSWYRGIMTSTLPLIFKEYEQYYVVCLLDILKDLKPKYDIIDNENYYEFNFIESSINKINEINPDYIVVWNGYFSVNIGNSDNVIDLNVQEFIKKFNKDIKIIYVEWGWFDHYETIGVHKNGPHVFSDLVNMNLNDIEINYNLIQHYRNEYTKNLQKPNIEDYILIPLQLVGDTQLMFSDFKMKNQNELIIFIRNKFPNKNIVVKIHPKSNEKETIKKLCYDNNCTYVEDNKIIDWIYYSDVVIGINSTTLIESLLLYKKTVAFGKNVFSNKDLVLDCTIDINNIDNIDNFLVDDDRKMNIDKFIMLLLNRQFNNNVVEENDNNKLLNILKLF